MKLTWSNRTMFVVGLALIAAANGIALGGAAYNRAGEPDSMLALTERELPIVNWSWPDNDNSGIDLQVEVRVRRTLVGDDGEIYGYWREDWLTEEQLRLLGFDVATPLDTEDALERRRRELAKNVFLALEYDGPAYQYALEQRREHVKRMAKFGDERLKAAREALREEENHASRLFAVDAGMDRDALRKRYPDRKRYAIVRGRLSTEVIGASGSERIIAGAPQLDIKRIRVPHAHRKLVDPLRQREYPFRYEHREPRYAARVTFGRRLEPWIDEMQAM